MMLLSSIIERWFILNPLKISEGLIPCMDVNVAWGVARILVREGGGTGQNFSGPKVTPQKSESHRIRYGQYFFEEDPF